MLYKRRTSQKCPGVIANSSRFLQVFWASTAQWDFFIHVLPASWKTALMWISKLKKTNPNVYFKKRTGFISHGLLYSCVHKLCLGIPGMLNYSSIKRAKIIYSSFVSYWMRLYCNWTNNRAQGDTYYNINRAAEGKITKLKCLEIYNI